MLIFSSLQCILGEASKMMNQSREETFEALARFPTSIPIKVTERHIEKRIVRPRQRVYKCQFCGHTQLTEFDVCPMCGREQK